MTLVHLLGICVALGFFLIWLDVKSSYKAISSMRNDISVLHSRIVALERGTEKSD